MTLAREREFQSWKTGSGKPILLFFCRHHSSFKQAEPTTLKWRKTCWWPVGLYWAFEGVLDIQQRERYVAIANCQMQDKWLLFFCFFQILLDIPSDSHSLSLWKNHALACSIQFALPLTWRYSLYLDTFANAHIFYSDMHQVMLPCASYWLQLTDATSLCCYCFRSKFYQISLFPTTSVAPINGE